MLEFVLIAVLHLDGDVLGPSTIIDIYPTEQLCIEQASNAQDIVHQLQYEWFRFRKENAELEVPVLLSIGMFCKPIHEVEENSI
tara:strand:- start:56 stop:307 length:252 start_codon:yes stop_codon:yes gene_type:complete